MYIQKKREDVLSTNQSQRASDLLAESERAIREGRKEHAYRTSVQATQIAPASIEAWLLRATLAPSLNEKMISVNRLNELAPNFQDRYNVAFFALKEALEQNPFLAYLEETDELYRVLNAERVVLSIPKKRAPVNSAPPEEAPSGPLRTASRWLKISILGLFLAGIGTVIFAPLTALAAIQAGQAGTSHNERVRSVVILIASFVLFIVGLSFSLLFVLHWFG